VNDLLCRDLTDPGMFVTVFLGVYEEDSAVMRYTNAGHNPPLIDRVTTGSIEMLTGGGVGMGIVPEARYQELSAKLDPGDMVVLYTDGVTEARGASGEQFGLERLQEPVRACRGMSARKTVEEIVSRVTDWRGRPVFADDLTVVAARKE
jgi:sigma-B regulation protein RsbU (phosphoserine phosphatase)